MGQDKPWLPIAAETMLQRVVRLLGEAVRPVVVVSRAGQELPQLPGWAHVVHDLHEGFGPMEGLATAMERIGDRADAVFVTGCDAPLLQPRFVRRMIEAADGVDIAVPHVRGFDQPFAAVYRTRLLAQIRALLAAGERRIAVLFDRVATRRIMDQDLQDIDPHLQSLVNVNDIAAYSAVLERLA
jgi:molybdenum cofactor guanylyltransferase